MSPYVQMFLFLFKSKYRRKYSINFHILYLVIIYSSLFNLVFCTKCSDVKCINGECVNGTCVCFDGWRGPSCQWCTGKVKLSGTSGYIHDGIGNYSIDVKCSWLIDGSAVPNSSIRLHIDEFATECGWDYLYIYDGDSVHSPLLAVYSGLMYKGDYSIRRVPEVVAHSGYALIHFYSDVAYNMSGFNISYRLNSCPSSVSDRNCSGHGVCLDGVCTCDGFYTGSACDVPICPNNCSYSNGLCHMEKHKCDCSPKYKGEDCSQVADLGYWDVVETKNNFLPKGSASHSAVVWKDSLYIIGGESYHIAEMMYSYNFSSNTWHDLPTRTNIVKIPATSYGQSAVLFEDAIYLYGGVRSDGTVSNELWVFDVIAKSWENITVRAEACNGTTLCGPLKSAGHTATLISSKNKRMIERMVVIFGHSPVYGYLNTVQEYYFGTREWIVVNTIGFPNSGSYGHSSTWDPLTENIYVFGGYLPDGPTNKLYSYNPETHIWTLLSDGPSARFLHTATILNNLMLVFGGNTQNDTTKTQGAKCYSADFLSYDVVCDSWAPLQVPSVLVADLPRFGHSAVTFNDSLYIYGGFDGQMLNDMLKFTSGKCEHLNSMMECLHTRSTPGRKCIWDKNNTKCRPADVHMFNTDLYELCKKEDESSLNNQAICGNLHDCLSCEHTSYGCTWCQYSNSCTHESICKELAPKTEDINSYVVIDSNNNCNLDKDVQCSKVDNCKLCTAQRECVWTTSDRCASIEHTAKDSITRACGPVCSDLINCSKCTKYGCIWCQSEQLCVPQLAYQISFPYGQCRDYHYERSQCPSKGNSICEQYATCQECRNSPECGWCDDHSGTGLGACLSGSNNPPKKCPKGQWYFTQCPSCQCNGHSTCANNSSVCVQPCANLTYGEHCETCIPGYYGYPVNGGTCTPCECNNHAASCASDTGKCHCTTKGIIGEHCDTCDLQNHYIGNPLKDESCYYDLKSDFSYTFNLSKPSELHYDRINFRISPAKPDVDTDLQLTCSSGAKFNISVMKGTQPTKPLLFAIDCSNTTYTSKFNSDEYIFGKMNATRFTVVVYDLKTPFWVQISFAQYSKVKVKSLLVTIFVCLLLIVLIIGLLWFLKYLYDRWRSGQLSL